MIKEPDPRIQGFIDAVALMRGCDPSELIVIIRGGVGSPDTQLAKSGEPVRTDTK